MINMIKEFTCPGQIFVGLAQVHSWELLLLKKSNKWKILKLTMNEKF